VSFLEPYFSSCMSLFIGFDTSKISDLLQSVKQVIPTVDEKPRLMLPIIDFRINGWDRATNYIFLTERN
jgi:hypothetical protein